MLGVALCDDSWLLVLPGLFNKTPHENSGNTSLILMTTFLLTSIAEYVPLSVLRQNFRDKKYLQALDDYGEKPKPFDRKCQPPSTGRIHYKNPTSLLRNGVSKSPTIPSLRARVLERLFLWG